jgi:hypothetical protein
MQAFTIVDVAGGVLLAILASVYVFRYRERACAEHIAWVNARPQLIGVVERLKEHAGDETTYTPLIVYTLPNGQRYAIDGESSGLPQPPVGNKIEIAYEPTMPSTARLVTPDSLSSERSWGDVIGFAALTFAGTLAIMFIRAAIEWRR